MRLILSVAFLSIFTLNSFAQRTITLEEALKIALQRNTTLQRERNNLQGSHANVKSAYGGLLPTLGANASWDWTRSEGKGGTIFSQGQEIRLPASQEDRSYSLNAGLDWTLFDGLANFATINQSKNNLEAAKFSFDRLKQDIIFGTTSRYYLVLGAEELLKVRQEDLAWNQKNLEVINARNELGAVTLADVYAQQVRVGNSEIALIQAQNDLETQKSELMNFLGVDILSDLTLVNPLKVDSTELQRSAILLQEYKDIKSLVDRAMENRPDLRSANLLLESAYNGITISKSGYFPRITNSIGYRTSATTIGALNDTRSYSVGLGVSIPIFSGFQTETSVELSKINARIREIQVTELERTIKVDLKKTYLDFQTAQKQLEVSQKNVQAAEQNRRIEQEKYNIGAGTLVNLLLASSEYTLAQQNRISTEFQFLSLKSQLEYYLGILDYKRFE